MMYTWLASVLLVVSRARGAAVEHNVVVDGALSHPMASADVPACPPVPLHVLQQHNLTDVERALLDDLCWWPDEAQHGLLQTRNTIPPGVQCEPYTWCDGDNVCSIVCKRGTVQIEHWLQHAIKTQTRLAQRMPLCMASMLGTHNSAITLADGYGNLDLYFEQYLKWIKWAGNTHIQTNNQWLSLTDQLNLGVRVVEVDTHWVEGYLRIAHCGGAHIAMFNRLIDAVNVVAKLLGQPIRWDTETFGCTPSLSSIPAGDQRRFLDALQEVGAWLDVPQNADEFVVLFLDDQEDLQSWGLIPMLVQEILSVFPQDIILTPPELASRYHNQWPSMAQLLADGKRVMIVSLTDYKDDMAGLIFPRGLPVCRWLEPELVDLQVAPECSLMHPKSGRVEPMHAGRLLRTMTCELMYGPMNCDFVYHGVNAPLLDEYALPQVIACGLNIPSPDLLTPERTKSTIWTWAPGHPFDATGGGSSGGGKSRPVATWWRPLQKTDESTMAWLWHAARLMVRVLMGHVREVVEGPAECSAVRVVDGRWVAVPCESGYPTACRRLQGGNATWELVNGGACPEGTVHAVPIDPPDGSLLQQALATAGIDFAFLPVRGPDWLV